MSDLRQKLEAIAEARKPEPIESLPEETEGTLEPEPEVIVSPVRSAQGNLRNVKKMLPDKFRRTCHDFYSGGYERIDPKGDAWLAAEMERREEEAMPSPVLIVVGRQPTDNEIARHRVVLRTDCVPKVVKENKAGSVEIRRPMDELARFRRDDELQRGE